MRDGLVFAVYSSCSLVRCPFSIITQHAPPQNAGSTSSRTCHLKGQLGTGPRMIAALHNTTEGN